MPAEQNSFINEAPRVDTRGVFSALRRSEIPPKQKSSHSSTVLQPWFSAKADKSTLKQKEPIEVLPVHETKVLLSWRAPLRPFKKQDREFWMTVLSIAFLLSVILLFVQEWLLIAVIVSLIFVYYAYSTIPSEEVENKITNKGIHFVGTDYLWEGFNCYWFAKKWDQDILNFETKWGFPKRLQLLLGEKKQEEVKDILGKYLPEETPTPSFLDKAADWLSKKFPLEIR